MQFYGEPLKNYYLIFSANYIDDSYKENLFGYPFPEGPNEIIRYENKLRHYYYYIPVSVRDCISGEITVNTTNMFIIKFN